MPKPKIIKEIGIHSLVIGIGQIALTFGLGWLLSYYALGFGFIVSLYIALALTFSSTIIVTKLLSDERQMDSLYGKISIGILIIQDFVAIVVLMFVSSTGGKTNFLAMLTKGLFGEGLWILLLIAGFFIIPRVIKNIAKSQELLFLFSICWCLLIAMIFSLMGLSIEIGALVAGVALSMSPFSTEISARIRPLRDFFLIIFFIILGFNINASNIGNILLTSIILSAFVIIIKPIIIMSIMAILGYTKRNNFITGITLAQISEFSLIVLALGVEFGQISKEILSTLTLTGIITITISTYFIVYSEQIYNKMGWFASIFEKKNVRDKKEIKKRYDAILFGYNRIGFSILKSLKRIGKSYVVIDFNPDTITNLKKLRVPCIYGDVFDTEFLNELPLEDTQLVISTVPDFEGSMLLIENIKRVNRDAIIIVRSHQIDEALKLYDKGANYVLTPHFLGGEYVSNMIEELKTNKEGYKSEKIKHITTLKERFGKGHVHPDVERD